MNVMKCDRCGKYVDSNDVPAIRGWKTETARMVGKPVIKMDLCPECFEALEEFLLNESTRREEESDDDDAN